MLKDYLIAFCTSDADVLDDQNNRRYWRCSAESYAHAVEQLQSAEPMVIYYELIEGPAETLSDCLADIASTRL
jgi:hypothetical protein